MYKYEGKFVYLIKEDNTLHKFQNLSQLRNRILQFLHKQILNDAMPREYRNVFLNKWNSLIPISIVKNFCPIVTSSNELDHAIGMSIDSKYRNKYNRDSLIDYLKKSQFDFVHPRNSKYGYYYKKRSNNEYVVIDIARFDDNHAQYVFDLLVVSRKRNSTYPMIDNEDRKTVVCDFNIFTHRNLIDDLFIDR